MSELKNRARSEPDERCRTCGDLFKVCPRSIKKRAAPKNRAAGHGFEGYRILGCCDDCTHWGDGNIRWYQIRLNQLGKRKRR